MNIHFWNMSKLDIDAYIETHGLAAWRQKVAQDRMDAPRSLAREPNPWLPENLDEKRQNIILSLAPKLAAELQKAAKSE